MDFLSTKAIIYMEKFETTNSGEMEGIRKDKDERERERERERTQNESIGINYTARVRLPRPPTVTRFA